MDATKKAEFEKRAVLGLAAVFVIVFIAGPARSMGLFGSRQRAPEAATEPVGTVAVAKSVSGMLQEGWDKMGEQLDSVSAPAQDVPVGASQYTAFDQRDPFHSFLPKTAAETAAEQVVVSDVPLEPPPPPELRVEGLLWGGPEPKAIINGRLYRVEDRVEGAKIVRIDSGGVTVEYLGKPIVYSTGAGR